MAHRHLAPTAKERRVSDVGLSGGRQPYGALVNVVMMGTEYPSKNITKRQTNMYDQKFPLKVEIYTNFDY